LAATLPDVRDLVVCHPADIGDWEPALVTFVKQIAAKKPVRRSSPAKKAAAKKRKRGRKVA
jgi:hypothetical protein